jgi:hypothetical protein
VGGDRTARASAIVPLAQRRGAKAHESTDRGCGMACCDDRDRFWAQVKTLGGRPRSGSQLSSTLTDLTLLRIAIVR